MKFTLSILLLLFGLQASFSQLGGSLGDLIEGNHKAIPSSYSFDYEYVLQINDKHGSTTIIYLINMKDDVVAMKEVKEDETTIYLLDHKRKISLVYVEGNSNKAYTILPYINPYLIAKGMSGGNNNTSIEATGKTKLIAGYNCKEYKAKDNRRESIMYINHDVELDEKMFYGFQNVPIENLSGNTKIKSGLLMQINSHKLNKPTKGQVETKCLSLEKGSYQINNSEYHRSN